MSRERSIMDNIPQKGNVFANVPPRDPTRLVISNNKMYDLKETPSKNPSSQLVINIKKGDRTPVARVEPITLLKRQRDDTTTLRGREKTRIETRIKYRDKIRTNDIPEFDIELHGQAVRPGGLVSGHTHESLPTLLNT